MIGIDTNILLRLLTRDDERQFQKAVVLIDALSDDVPGFISLVVVTELAALALVTWAVCQRSFFVCATLVASNDFDL